MVCFSSLLKLSIIAGSLGRSPSMNLKEDLLVLPENITFNQGTHSHGTEGTMLG